ncbi:hypothetical protein ADL00_17305 [Streptomyces sp. AS58]|uniref:hypothetical protein n=1 Tax=Streptomyces sp. AS58 TaxID=1519489 RepID=UPI0006AFEB47|nr:hypothetical protein [Streptomyces sp. AS58]KOV66574.1 hypothetical protein ADL00_17305 [Streptomyces sp. AS58]
MARPINKIKLGKAVKALTTAGMSPALAAQAARLLDLDAELAPQVAALAEEDPELFEPAEDDSEDEPMTAQEAKRARARGLHPLLPERGEGTPAQRNAAALGAGRPRPARPSTAPATARKAAEILTRGIGSAADR